MASTVETKLPLKDIDLLRELDQVNRMKETFKTLAEYPSKSDLGIKFLDRLILTRIANIRRDLILSGWDTISVEETIGIKPTLDKQQDIIEESKRSGVLYQADVFLGRCKRYKNPS